MPTRSLLVLVACVFSSVFGAPRLAHAADAYSISAPVQHANLAIYFVHGKSASGPVPLTLQEALAKGVVQVRETGSVNDLEIENTGKDPVFVQSGEIVKGGRQDRVVTSSLVLPPHSGRVSMAAYCVEHGRWSARGGEAGDKFSSADAALPSREAKLAMKAPEDPARGPRSERSDTGARQQKMWAGVAVLQQQLSTNVGAPVASPESESSLQLSLENKTLQKVEDEYVKALLREGEKTADIVGYVFAINGKLNSADLYPSNGLFRKMWPKLLRASVTEAISNKSANPVTPPASGAVMAFLKSAEQGQASKTAVNDRTQLETRDSDKALYFETTAAAASPGEWVHRNYIAK